MSQKYILRFKVKSGWPTLVRLKVGWVGEVDSPGNLLWDDRQLPTSKLLKLLPRETSLFQPDTMESR